MAFGCIWRSPFTSVQVLAQLVPGNDTCPIGISADGTTLVGAAVGIDSHWHACRWDTTTLAITALEQVATPSEIAVACSSNGSVVYGGGGSGSGDTSGSQQIRPMTMWTGGGASGSPLPGGISSPTFIGWRGNKPFPLCSDDGVTAVGFAPGGTATVYDANKWTSGVQVSLSTPTVGIDVAAQAISVSADGSIVIGQMGESDSGAFTADACYWVGTTQRRLAQAIGGGSDPFELDVAYYTNHNGSIVWGQVQTTTGGGQIHFAYWDNLSSFDGVRYGTAHVMPDLPNTQEPGAYAFVFGVADTPGVYVAVGFSPSGSSTSHACKWVGTTAVDLGTLPGASVSLAEGCSGDGTLACGYSYDAGFLQWPVWWDSENAIHKLPTLADPSDFFQGEAYGFRRDGSLIFGVIDVGDTPTETLTDAELIFQPGTVFADFTSEATRRLFVSTGGTPAWVGPSGSIPFNGVPAVYLTTEGPALDFAQNNGNGGAFVPSGELDPAGGPGCTPYYVTEAAGPAGDPQWRLNVSDDGGRTWSTLVKPRSIGKLGEYQRRLRWLKMGQARERMVRLECTDPVRRNIIGIYIDTDEGLA